MRKGDWVLAGLCSLLALPLILREPAAQASAAQEIGFRVIERLDATRASSAFPSGRPIQIAFWYPAAAASGSPAIAFRDYVELAGRETSFDPANRPSRAQQAVERYKLQLSAAHVKPEEADALLATRMHALKGSPAALGRFPLVLIAPGNDQSAHDHAFLAESLAERGYVVALPPSATRIAGHMTKESDIPEMATAQAADLAVALRTARFETVVRAGRYGVVAHSFGARAALLLAMGDADLGALVSLDGGIGSKDGKGWLEKAKGFNRARATAPILHYYGETDKSLAPDFDLLRSLDRSNRYLINVDAMAHVHFSSVGAQVATLPALALASAADARTSDAWNAVVAATASFLDHFVSDSAATNQSPWTPPALALLHPTTLKSAPTPTPTPMASAGSKKTRK
ncbi:MAG TPA: dienelactone hydrolase family protein [Thermoanaerobaculia bacterium]|nr:dienelactone hydrolase family protein [Thermoanaerobaculia bacterium]